MSGRKKSDYRKVFRHLIEILPSAPAVQQVTLDFEKAVWTALRDVIPQAVLQGCVFLQLPMYILIQLLHREARLTALQIRLVSDKKLKRIQRLNYRQLQSKLFDLWEEYEANERSAKQLLKACSYLNGPRGDN